MDCFGTIKLSLIFAYICKGILQGRWSSTSEQLTLCTSMLIVKTMKENMQPH
ncbi:hypothetical protein RchiOBHm_Chr5g0066591 [Rosa chinensis]|uniref:Uncharacterized protein n=1 Tax=Rosa chinensis TaxID=74649 RepID=A0A2P6QJ74_ROSCH|nr:hypothetical protein RchiOBHm_Chr7g0206091 [Rosa chinensis]PRQ24639.1 hypothetical protein RchiOBHm_Chr6g0274651 [Rosa chinensis]PRQ34235.1 hypothetical protein RchiOBHm_Chr5g0066591 [Rosa chinensis]